MEEKTAAGGTQILLRTAAGGTQTRTAACGTQLLEILLALGDEVGEAVEDEVKTRGDFLGGAVGQEPLEGERDIGGDMLVQNVKRLDGKRLLPLLGSGSGTAQDVADLMNEHDGLAQLGLAVSFQQGILGLGEEIKLFIRRLGASEIKHWNFVSPCGGGDDAICRVAMLPIKDITPSLQISASFMARSHCSEEEEAG